jgi:hypothetical protein
MFFDLYFLGIFAWGFAIFALALGVVLGIPMIWYHISHISRKLDKIIDLADKGKETKK